MLANAMQQAHRHEVQASPSRGLALACERSRWPSAQSLMGHFYRVWGALRGRGQCMMGNLCVEGMMGVMGHLCRHAGRRVAPV